MTVKLLLMVELSGLPADDTAELQLNNQQRLSETIDGALGIAAFGIEVSLVFIGAAVEYLSGKLQLKIINALPHYDIENIYASSADIRQYFEHFPEPAIQLLQLDEQQLIELIGSQDTVLRMG